MPMGARPITREGGSRDRGITWLLATQRADGGWGYQIGGTGYVEPTVLATLALTRSAPTPESESAARRAGGWLRQLQRADGSWGVSPADAGPSWMSAYAIWGLLSLQRALGDGEAAAAVEAGLRWLLAPAAPVMSAEQADETRWTLRIDGSLVGWPWVPGDADWVFPTAISILAASVAGHAKASRVQQGLTYLRDRACEGGGWNVGNPYMFDKPFAPTVADTAAVLLAMRGAGQESSPAAVSGLERLRELVRETESAYGLAWGILAMRAYGADVTEPLARLLTRQASDGSWQSRPPTTALAVLALGDQPIV